MAIILAMETLSLAEVKNHLSEYVDRVAGQRDRVTITRNGRPSAVLVNPEDLESLEETLAILSNNREVRAIRAGFAAIDAEEGLSLENLRTELDRASKV